MLFWCCCYMDCASTWMYESSHSLARVMVVVVGVVGRLLFHVAV